MADDTAGNIAAVSQQGNISGLIALMNALYPAGGYNSTQTTGPQTVTTSDKTQTTEEIASPEAVQQLVQQMLQGTSGLAAVAQGEKGAGLYNTTTNQQLMNDLMSRVASAGAALNKKTVQTISGGTTTTSGQTTTANKTMTPQLTAADLAKLVGGGAAAAAAASALKNALSSGGAGKSEAGKKNTKGAPDDLTDDTSTASAYDLKNSPVWDQQFVQAIDPSLQNNPSDQVQFAAQGDSMLMTPVNDYNGLLNQSLNMGGLLNENNVESTNTPTDNNITGSVDLSGIIGNNSLFGNDSDNSGGFFQNVGADTSSEPSQDVSNATPTTDNSGYATWDEYSAANPNTAAGDRFNVGGTDYIATSSDNVVPYDSFESTSNSLGFDSSDMSNFDWNSFDADAGYNGADDWLNYGTW